MIEFMEIKRYPLINQIFGNGFQQNKKKIDELKIFNLHTTFKSKTELIFIMYLIVISKYETQDMFCKHCIKEDKCKVLATENNTNKAKSKILILPAT